jgi:hypothetical protein
MDINPPMTHLDIDVRNVVGVKASYHTSQVTLDYNYIKDELTSKLSSTKSFLTDQKTQDIDIINKYLR